MTDQLKILGKWKGKDVSCSCQCEDSMNYGQQYSDARRRGWEQLRFLENGRLIGIEPKDEIMGWPVTFDVAGSDDFCYVPHYPEGYVREWEVNKFFAEARDADRESKAAKWRWLKKLLPRFF